jgi:hypothetical protein
MKDITDLDVGRTGLGNLGGCGWYALDPSKQVAQQ